MSNHILAHMAFKNLKITKVWRRSDVMAWLDGSKMTAEDIADVKARLNKLLGVAGV